MNRKRTLQIVIDLSMTILLPLLMTYSLIGETAHEWIGASMLLLFIAHHILNYRWFRSLFKGRCSPVRILNTAVNLLLLIDVLLQGISGIVMSRQVFSFLNIQQGASFARVVQEYQLMACMRLSRNGLATICCLKHSLYFLIMMNRLCTSCWIMQR